MMINHTPAPVTPSTDKRLTHSMQVKRLVDDLTPLQVAQLAAMAMRFYDVNRKRDANIKARRAAMETI